MIQVRSDEILLDGATRLAEKTQSAGTEVTLDVWKGMLHVWQMIADFVPKGRPAIAGIGRYLDGVLGS